MMKERNSPVASWYRPGKFVGYKGMRTQTITNRISASQGKVSWFASPSKFTILILLPFILYAACPCTSTPAMLIAVFDGDTTWFLVEGERTRIHFSGIDAPELEQTEADHRWCPEEGEKAISARDFVNQVLQKAKQIRLEIKGEDPDGSIWANVYANGKSVGQELLYQYLAVEGMEDKWFD